MNKKTKPISIRVTEEEEKNIKANAEKQGTSVSAYISMVLKNQNSDFNFQSQRVVWNIKTLSETVYDLIWTLRNNYLLENKSLSVKHNREQLKEQVDNVEKEMKELWQSLR